MNVPHQFISLEFKIVLLSPGRWKENISLMWVKIVVFSLILLKMGDSRLKGPWMATIED